MSKKHRQAKRQEAVSAGEGGDSTEGITPLGMKVIGAGVAVIILGFFVLSRADAMGSNWAANLSPFLILGGYILVGLGIFAPAQSSSQGLSGQH